MSLLLRNAAVWPERELRPIYIAEGHIAAFEDRPADETIDLEGAFVLPGFVDTHTHLGWAGEALWRVNWGDVRTREEALDRIRATCGRIEAGFWLLGGGWKRDRLADAELPTLEELDAVTGTAPAYLASADGSLALVNSHAMRLMRLAELADPAGGTIERDTGRLHAASLPAMLHITRGIIPVADRHRRLGEMRAALRELPRLGITEAHDIATVPGETSPPLIQWERSWSDATLFDELDLPARISVRPSLHRRHEFFDRANPYLDGSVHLEGMKLFAGPAFRYPGRATATEWIREAHEAGLSVSVHTLGDDDVAETIDLFEPCGGGGPRHRLVHARSIRRRDIPRIVRLGLIVESQPWDTLEDPRTSDDPDAVALPLRSLLDAGVPVALGSDWRNDNLVPLDPLHEIHAAVDREEEAISVSEAIRCYTQGGAFAGGNEARRGRVLPGLDADLVALSRSPADEPEALLETTVLLTVCAGRVVHSA